MTTVSKTKRHNTLVFRLLKTAYYCKILVKRENLGGKYCIFDYILKFLNQTPSFPGTTFYQYMQEILIYAY